MKNLLLAPLIFFVAIIAIISCNNNSRINPYINNLHLKPSYLASLDTPNYTHIEWLDSLKDFGTIERNQKIDIDFRFKNVGDKPLFIVEAMTNCGCTVANLPADPVFSGEESKITATFDSQGQPDSIFKTILITSNTKPFARHYLGIKGKIKPSVKKE